MQLPTVAIADDVTVFHDSRAKLYARGAVPRGLRTVSSGCFGPIVQDASESAPPDAERHASGPPPSDVRLVMESKLDFNPPRRVQPLDAGIYIGRGTHSEQPSTWGNPFCMKYMCREAAVAQFRKYLVTSVVLMSLLPTLSNRSIRCNCTLDQLCHGDVIIDVCKDLSNQPVKFSQWMIDAQHSAFLVDLLEGISWPQQRRPNVQGHGRCIGLTSTPTGKYINGYRPEYRRLVVAASSVLRQTTGRPDLRFTSLQVNRNTIASLHRDAGNSD